MVWIAITPKLYIISYSGTILSPTNCPTLHGRDDIYGRRVLGESDRKERDSHCWSQELQYNYYSTCGASTKIPDCRPGTRPTAPLHYKWTLLAFAHGSFSRSPPLLLPLLSFLHISFRGLHNKEHFCWPKRDFHLSCQQCHTYIYSNVLILLCTIILCTNGIYNVLDCILFLLSY